MTISSERPKTFDAGFRYAKLGRDPKFRQHLKDIGWTNGTTVVIADEAESVGAVLLRVFANADGPVSLIAMEMEGQPFGWALLFVELRRITWRNVRNFLRRRANHIDIAPEATIGMLYASFAKCGEYVPSEWVKPVIFEKART